MMYYISFLNIDLSVLIEWRVINKWRHKYYLHFAFYFFFKHLTSAKKTLKVVIGLIKEYYRAP